MVRLSSTDQNKYRTLLEAYRDTPVVETTPGQETDPIRYRAQRRLSASESEDLVERYRAGGTVRGLAESFRMSREGVRSALRRANVAIRTVELLPLQLEEARHLRAEGWSLNKLGARYGMDPKTVKSRLGLAT